MYKILHFADLHLDASFAGVGFPSIVARKYREHLRDTLVRILDLAREKQVDAVTIAGDLYEQERFSRDTGAFLIAELQRLAPIRVFIAPGNHDPFVSESLYRFLNWPANVTIFHQSEFSPFQLNSEITLWGTAHTSPTSRKNPLHEFRVPEKGRHILLFHGSDMSNLPTGKSAHAPFQPRDVPATGADLALVGHYHRGKYQSEEKFFYPGSPEPLGFGEKGDHTVGLISVQSQGISVEPLSINQFSFQTGEIDVSACTSREDIKKRVEEWASSVGTKKTFLKAILVGELAGHIELDLELLQDKLNETCAHGMILNGTRPGLDLGSLQGEKTVRGEYVRTMMARIETLTGSERKKYELALIYGLQAFEGREIISL